MNDEVVRDRQEAVAPAKASINRDAPPTRLIAGVSVPDGPLITAAIDMRSGSPSRICSITRCAHGCSQK